MIVTNNQSEVVQVVGENTSKKATINTNEIAKLQYILTEGLYSDAIGATIVELSNNAIDSVVEAGKDPLKNPVVVELNSKNNIYKISIKDTGLGMSKEFFEESFMCYLTSTKSNNNNTIGFYGIGGKSWSSLKRSVNFTIVQNGIKCKYLCYKGAEGVEHDLVLEESTNEENGVLFEMNIKDWTEYNQFKTKAKKKLTYYDTIVLIIDDDVIENKIYRNDLFQYAEDAPYHDMHLCLKDVVYTIDWDKINIAKLNIPIAIRFNLSDGLTPTPSREALLLGSDTIKLIQDKIKLISDWFVSKYNEQVREFSNIIDAWDHIDSKEKYITLDNKTFDCSQLEEFSNYKFNKPVVSGINLKTPSYYKKLRYELVGEYEAIAFDVRGTWKKKYLNNEINAYFLHQEVDIIEFDKNLAGKIKTFLRNKHGSGTLYVNKIKNYNLRSYKNILYLKSTEKANWRNLIKEFQLVIDQITSSRFISESNIENTDEYINWVIEQQRASKEKRKNNIITGDYKGLNKQSGEITIGKVREYKYGGKVAIDRFTKKIDELNTIGRLSVYMEKDSIDNIEQYYFFKAFPGVDFVELNKREIIHVEKLKTWMTMTEFKESRPFSRLVTSLEIANLEDLAPINEDIIYETFPKYHELKKKLLDYALENTPDSKNYHIGIDAEKVILNYAKETNSYDMNIWSDVLKFKKLMKDFGFLNYLDINGFDNMGDESQKVIKNMVYIILKNKKINCKFVEDYELVDKVPQAVLEEMYKEDLEPQIA